jgi:hypothetical protein
MNPQDIVMRRNATLPDIAYTREGRELRECEDIAPTDPTPLVEAAKEIFAAKTNDDIEFPEDLITFTREEIIQALKARGVDMPTYVRRRADKHFKKEILDLRERLASVDVDVSVCRKTAQADAYGELRAFLKGHFDKFMLHHTEYHAKMISMGVCEENVDCTIPAFDVANLLADALDHIDKRIGRVKK